MGIRRCRIAALTVSSLLLAVPLVSNYLGMGSSKNGVYSGVAYGHGMMSNLQTSLKLANETVPGRRLYIELCHTCHGPILSDPDYEAATANNGMIFPVMAPPHGPNLTGVVGREAGSVVGYDYSDPFLKYLGGMIWDDGAIDSWIFDSQGVAPGSRMYFKEPQEVTRREIVSYLAAH